MAHSSSTPVSGGRRNRYDAISDDINNSLDDSLSDAPREKGLQLLGQMRDANEEAKLLVLGELAKSLGVEHMIRNDPSPAAARPAAAAAAAAKPAASAAAPPSPAFFARPSGPNARDDSLTRKRRLDTDAGGADAKRRQMSTSGGKVESVFLSGVSDNVKKNGIVFKREFSKALPHINITQVHNARSGSVILTPATPADFSRLMKEDWSKHVSLGINIKASTDKGKKVEYKAVITGVDPELDDDVLKTEIEERNQLKVTELVRLLNKGTTTKLWKVKITLENEEAQRRVLKNGIYLGYERHKCLAPFGERKDEKTDDGITQCFRCQKWDPDHNSGRCNAKQACLWCGDEHFHRECPHFQKRDKGRAKCANCNEAHPAWTKTCQAFLTASQHSTKASAAKIVSSSSVSRRDLEAEVKVAVGGLWETLATVISTVVSKAILDLNEELKKPKVDQGGLAMKVTSNTVRAIKECGLLLPSKPIEVVGVQQNVWKDVFPQTPFPRSNQAGSAPQENVSSQSSK